MNMIDVLIKYAPPTSGAALGGCFGAYRFAWWLGHTRPAVFGIHNAYPSVALFAGLGAGLGVALAGLLQRQRQRQDRGRLVAWLLDQSGRPDLEENDRAVIASLYQEISHHQRQTKRSSGY